MTPPDTVELCIQPRQGYPCLGVVYRMSPDQSPYCYQCGARKVGVAYAVAPVRA